jgi:hypothetical protein
MLKFENVLAFLEVYVIVFLIISSYQYVTNWYVAAKKELEESTKK